VAKRPAARVEPAPAPPQPALTQAPRAAAVPAQEACPDELAALQLAQRWLQSNAPLEALRQLDRLDEKCRGGNLLEERTATRAIALCLSGSLDEGRAQLQGLK